MDILADIIASIKEDVPVHEVRIGPFWTAVVSRGCGLASTLIPPAHNHLESPIHEAGYLAGRSALELARMAHSDNTLAAGVGIAAINSLIRVDESECVELNARDYLLERGAGKRIALVGHFPFVPQLRQVAAKLWVTEKRPLEGDLDEWKAEEVFPQADIVAITGSAFVNGTIGYLLGLIRKGSHVMVLGPSTPMSPVLFEHGVNIVSGTQVVDIEAALRTLSEGATFRQMRGVKLLTMTREGTL